MVVWTTFIWINVARIRMFCYSLFDNTYNTYSDSQCGLTCWDNWTRAMMTTAAVARPSDATTTQAEDARANINVVLSTAYRQQQHGQDQLISTLPPRHDTTTPGQTKKCSEKILLLDDQVRPV